MDDVKKERKLFYEAEHPNLSAEEIEFYEKSFREKGEPVISDPILRTKIAVLIFIIAEIMYFGGLIATFFVMRKSALEWPPEGQPRYPVMRTLLNTAFLLGSGIFILAFAKSRNFLYLVLSLLGGVIFIVLQGVEWMRLVSFGLTMTSSLYGSIFYLIVGSHALHALAGIIWLGVSTYLLWRRKRRFNFKAEKTPSLEGALIFWGFVVLIWPVIYISVYLP